MFLKKINVVTLYHVWLSFALSALPIAAFADNVMHGNNSRHQSKGEKVVNLYVEAIDHLPELSLERSHATEFHAACHRIKHSHATTQNHTTKYANKAMQTKTKGTFSIATAKKTHQFEYQHDKLADGAKSYELLAEQPDLGLAALSLNTMEDSLGFRALYVLDKETDTLYHLNAEGDAGFDTPIFSKDGHAALLYENFVYDETSYMVMVHFNEQSRQTHFIRPIAFKKNNFQIDAAVWGEEGSVLLKTHQTKDINPHPEQALTQFSYWKVKTP